MKNHVTDGQLGQLAVKQHELFGRAKRRVYESIDEVLAAVQRVIEGQEPVIPSLAVDQRFAKWRSFFIGGNDKNTLLACVQPGITVGYTANELMDQEAFTVQDTYEEIETIILTPADFGYEYPPRTDELLNPVRLAEWSRLSAHRLPRGYVVELLPAEAGPHIRIQYRDQPKNETLWIAMGLIADSNGNWRVFSLDRGDHFERGLYTHWMYPEDPCGLHHRLVFRLRKIETTIIA